MCKKMSENQNVMNKMYSFIDEYKLISNSQLVDFFTKSLWNHCVPESIRSQFIYQDNDNEDLLKNNCIKDFYNYILLLKQHFVCDEFVDQEKNDTILNKQAKFNSEKKWHEIERLSKIVKRIINNDCALIIDAGAGKGYLSTYISRNCNIPVLAIETSDIVFHGALNYKQLLEKKTNDSYQKVKYVKKYIDESIKYAELVECNYANISIKDNLCLVGLHTCGSLVYSMVKSFLSNKEIQTFCVVPCCYHLADKLLNDDKYKLTRNQRMLAQQRLSTNFNANAYHPSLFYRAILQVILHSMGLDDAKVGRGVYDKDFTTYAKKALHKIGVPSEKIPTDDALTKIYNTYKNELQKFNIFHTLRLLIAPILEITILLDIVLYLESNMQLKQVKVMRIFDSNVSPRSYCIIAQK